MKNNTNIRKAWITWEVQPRNRSMANAIDADFFELLEKSRRPYKYFFLIKRTIPILLDKKYQVIVCQNPSIVLSALSIALKIFTKKVTIIDAHSAGIDPFEGRYRFANWICKKINQQADAVITTNTFMAERLRNENAHPIICPDPLPEIKSNLPSPSSERQYAFLVCSWQEDEPWEDVIEAAKNLPEIDLFISGNYKKRMSEEYRLNLPSNVIPLGFVSSEQYKQYVTHAEVLIDLTTRENCVLCGLYEGVSADIKVIASDTKAIREVFASYIFYTQNDRNSIEKSLVSAFRAKKSNYNELNQEFEKIQNLCKSDIHALVHSRPNSHNTDN